MIVETAPAKVNLVLRVGPRGDDGLHEVCSLFASIDLLDRIEVEPLGGAAAEADPRPDGSRHQVSCPGVEEPNVVVTALAAYERASGGSLPALRVEIDKRIPVAAGLGGGSADAAAVLRAADTLAGEPLGPERLRAIALEVGSDVPSQIEPRHTLVSGRGEVLEPVSLPVAALVLVPAEVGLSTADVYAEADRIGVTRADLDHDSVRAIAGADDAEELARGLENDLEAAALALRPELAQTLVALREAGALGAQLTGSGPTCFGLFADAAAAERAVALLGSVGARVGGALDPIVAPLRHY